MRTAFARRWSALALLLALGAPLAAPAFALSGGRACRMCRAACCCRKTAPGGGCRMEGPCDSAPAPATAAAARDTIAAVLTAPATPAGVAAPRAPIAPDRGRSPADRPSDPPDPPPRLAPA